MKTCWVVEFHEEFAVEVRKFSHAVREKLKASAIILSENGP
jgi:mRNA-degrading endonuclease RelE of RelBE toxin-antitoxin system